MTEALNNDYALPVQTQVTTVQTQVADGWVADANTWTYASADSPSFVVSVNADMTSTISAGMRVRLTQTTVKYFIVTAVGAFSGGATELTLYGGTDYVLDNASVDSPGYSNVKAPFGFPLNPAKWTVEVVDANDRTQLTPTAGSWYNLNAAHAIDLPVGVWNVSYYILLESSDTYLSSILSATLSTANNTESDAKNTSVFYFATGSAIGTAAGGSLHKSMTISVTSATTYYLNSNSGSVTSAELTASGSVQPTVIRAVCAYL